MNISAVIITFNEARNIGRCLESLQGIADEVVVVDSMSTDNTREICKKAGAMVVERPWEGYSANKNHGNGLVNHEYVLSIDADEALSPTLRQSILQIKHNLNGVYGFNRLAFYGGKAVRHGGWYPDRKIRLFPKHKARWEGGFVHEELIIIQSGQTASWLDGDLLHYTYDSAQEHRTKARKYARLAAVSMQKAGKNKLILGIKALVSPIWRFGSMFFFKLGFLDGKTGWNVAKITSKEVFWKYWWAAGPRLDP
jgi:(heptosyl)LPS beta-1,4-glucosyltransferase